MFQEISLMLMILLMAVKNLKKKKRKKFDFVKTFVFSPHTHIVMKALRRAHLFKYEVFNLGNNHPHGVLELVDLLEQNLGLSMFSLFLKNTNYYSKGKKAIKNFTAQAKGDVLTTFSEYIYIENMYFFRFNKMNFFFKKSIAKAGSLLDYAPQTSLADGIKHFADWYKGYYSDKI